MHWRVKITARVNPIQASHYMYAYAVYPANRHLPLKVRSLIDFLVDRFGENPYWEQY